MRQFSEQDILLMRRALRLAERAKGTTFPNPAVGAVITKGTSVVAEGATQRCGGAHAEVQALKSAGGKARGATMYVTLEPCCCYGRTAPCTASIVSSAIRKVVVACKDPNPEVSGKGIRTLREKGIEVQTGLLREDAQQLNEDFFWSITTRRAWISLKLALSLDGKIADARGTSQWITNTQARTFAHELRRRHAAVAVGRQTLLADDPSLTVRHVPGASPARVVFSSSPRAGRGTCLRRTARQHRSILVCPGEVEGRRRISRDGVEVWYTGKARRPRNLHVFARMAYDEGLTSILVEGGRQLASSFLEARVVNRLYLFYGNCILGAGLDAFSFAGHPQLGKAMFLDRLSPIRLGDNWVITGIPTWRT